MLSGIAEIWPELGPYLPEGLAPVVRGGSVAPSELVSNRGIVPEDLAWLPPTPRYRSEDAPLGALPGASS
jgi:hypothetical protein